MKTHTQYELEYLIQYSNYAIYWIAGVQFQARVKIFLKTVLACDCKPLKM
jgi:hypothetical protein